MLQLDCTLDCLHFNNRARLFFFTFDFKEVTQCVCPKVDGFTYLLVKMFCSVSDPQFCQQHVTTEGPQVARGEGLVWHWGEE